MLEQIIQFLTSEMGQHIVHATHHAIENHKKEEERKKNTNQPNNK